MAEAPSSTRQAQRVAVMNHAGLVLAFQVSYKDKAGKDCLTARSANLTNPQRATIDLAEAAGIEPGTVMKPVIYVMAGADKNGPEIEYAANALTAVYTVTGTIGDFHVELV